MNTQSISNYLINNGIKELLKIRDYFNSFVFWIAERPKSLSFEIRSNKFHTNSNNVNINS